MKFPAFFVIILCSALVPRVVRADIPLALGTTYGGSLTVPGESHTYTFTGAPGQILYLDSQDADNVNMSITLLSPEGTVLYSRNDDYDYGPFVLTEPGTYRLAVNGSGATTGSYQFRLLDLSAGAPLTLGTTLNGQLSPPLACNVYTFNGTRGQRVNLQSIAYAANQAQWELVSPANTVLASGQIYQSLGTVTLPFTGAYYLLVSGTASGAAPFAFQVLLTDVSDAPATAAGFGVEHSGNIGAGQTNSFSLTAPAGLPVYFDNLDTSGQSLVVDLVDPSGTPVFTVNETADAGPYVLPRSGTYTLQVRSYNGTASGNYDFRLLDLTTSPALPMNTTVSNVLSKPYQTDVYQLSGAAGQRLYYDAIDNDHDNVQVMLVRPDGQTPISGNSDSDSGPLTLPFTGTYYLIQQSGLSTSPNYVFQMLDAAAQPALPLNADFMGALPANTAAIYQLAGAAGEQLYFNSKGVSAGGAYWTLYRPDNVGLSGTPLTSDFEVTLGYPGNYLLVLSGGGNTVNYTNQANTFSFTTNALALNSPTNGVLVHPGDQLYYTFTGSAGQRLYYDALNASQISATVSLLSPTGASVWSGNANNDQAPATLTENGIYSLVFSGNGDATGPVNFQLLDVAVAPALPLNTDLIGTLPANTAAIYQLAGTAGEQLYFNAKGVSAGGAYWTLYRPDNGGVFGAGLASDSEATLGWTGQYVLVLSGGANQVSYANQVSTFSYTTNALVLNTPTNDVIVHPGDQLYYTFAGSAGQRLYYDSLSGTYASISVTLVSPTGAAVFSGNANYDHAPVTLTENGTYSLVFDGSGDTTGPVSFQLLDMAAQPGLPLNTDLIGTLPANTAAIYQLAGTMGEQLYFNAKGVSAGGANWTLYRPDDGQVSGAILGGDFEVTLGWTGQYMLVLSGGGNQVNYTNQANTFGYTTNALVLNSATNSVIVHPGDQVSYTFAGSIGQRLYYDARQTNYNTIQVTLVSPTGHTVFTGNATSADEGPVTLTENGTYTLVFDGNGDSTGPIAFNLLDLATAPALSLGTLSDTLDDQTQSRFYRFSGTIGQRLDLEHVSFSATQAGWKLIGTDDQTLGSASINNNIGTVTLPATGTYALVVAGNAYATSPLSFQVSITDVSDAPATASGFGVEHSGNIAAGQTNSFNLMAPAGLPVYFDNLDTSGQSLVVDLIDPFGTAVFTVYETGDAGPYILPRSGTYTLQVRSYNGSASGNYDFRLLDLTTSPALALNTVVSNSLNLPYETDVYQFSGSTGQTLFYDALANDANYASVAVQLENAVGMIAWQSGDFQNDSGPVTLPHSETQYLIFRGLKSPASGYKFQLLDLASQPPLAVNAPVTNSLAGYQSVVYRYSGAAGQRLYFQGQSGNPSGTWYLYGPQSASYLAGAGLTGDFQVTLPADGVYALLLATYNGNAGANVFQVNNYSYFTNSYTLGTAVTDTISRPGEQRFYTFNGVAGQRLYYDALTNDPPSPNALYVQLLNPQGVAEAISGPRFSSDRGPFTLQESGTFTLVFYGSSSSTGTYAFRLLDVSSQTALSINAPLTNALPGYYSAVYRYSGAAGQQLYFRGQSGNPSGNWTLYDPDNNSVGYAGLVSDFELTLPKDGVYTLVLAPYNGVPATNVFQVNDYAYFTNSYVLGTAVTGAISEPGEQRFYTFTGSAGQRLYYDALTNDPPSPNALYVQMLNPQGVAEAISGPRFSSDRGPFTLQESGTFTLVFYGSTSGTGTYAFRLLDLASQSPLPISAPVTNSLPAYYSVVYRYSGAAGQPLYFRGQSTNPSGTWTLYDPDNQSVGYAGLISDFELTLPKDGVYALVVTTYNGVPATNVFQVNPFNSGETLVINKAPVLNPIPNQITGEGSALTFTAVASDPDGNSLAFSLDPGGPAGATIGPASGGFNWIPPLTGYSFQTNVTVRVSDNGMPTLSVAQIVSIEVIAGPVMLTAQKTDGSATAFWRSAPGKHYHMQFKNKVTDPVWTDIGTDLQATNFVTSETDNTIGTNSTRFYRVRILDPQ